MWTHCKHSMQGHLLTVATAGQVILSDASSSRPAAASPQDDMSPATNSGAAAHTHSNGAAAALQHGREQPLQQGPPDQAPLPAAAVQQLHPLRPYAEYLAYLFRRADGPEGQEEMELTYRDYLQVGIADEKGVLPDEEACEAS